MSQNTTPIMPIEDEDNTNYGDWTRAKSVKNAVLEVLIVASVVMIFALNVLLVVMMLKMKMNGYVMIALEKLLKLLFIMVLNSQGL